MNPTSFDINTIILTIVIAVLILFSLVIIGYVVFTIFRWRGREERSINSVLLQIAVSKKQKFRVQPTISFEIVGRKEDIRFFVWVPKNLQDLVEKQIHSAYSDAEITEVDEYEIFKESGSVAYKSLQLKKQNYFPVKTFKDLPTDTLSAITSAMAKMGEDESAALQILISPAESKWQKDGSGFISETKKQEADPEKAKFAVPAKTLEAIESKIGKPGFETSIRAVVVSETKESAKMHLSNIEAAFGQFSGDMNNFGGRKVRRKGAFMDDFLYRYQPMFHFAGNRPSILNSEELATIYHFPNKMVTTPHIHWQYAKSAPAPAGIPMEGLYIGESEYRGIKRKVHISDSDRRRHMYIIGKTGTGKTELLKDLIMQDIRAGKGICFMDPHGDAVRDILEMIPPERAEDVVYFNPADTERPLGLNLLEASSEDEKHFAATAIINMMYKLFDPHKTGIVGPRFEHAVRNAMLTAMYDEGSTFIEIVRILTDSKFVQELLPKVEDPIIKRYWTDQIAQTSDFHKSEVLDYIVSKFGRFVTNKMIRNIIGQSRSAFSFREVMDSQKILLINLAKGELGEENSNFLGLILVPRILMAAMSRQDIPEEERKDFFLYVDEFQNFATPDFAQILSEARKYRLNLIVANQFVGQVEEEVKNAIFGNVGSLMCFRVGVTDANYLAHEFKPVFNEEDLLNIERYNIYMKTVVNNEPVPPFSVSLYKDMEKIKAQSNKRVAEIIIEMSRLKHGRDQRLVEAEITRRAKL